MPTNKIQLSTGNSSGAILRTYSATENSTVFNYQPAWVVFGANSTTPTVVSGSAGLPVAQQGTWILGANSGVDVGDVTINNSSATPVPTSIQIDTRPLEGSTGGHTSTAFGIVTRQVGDSSVIIKGNSTAIIQGNSTAAILASGQNIEGSSGAPSSTMFGLVTRPIGPLTIQGNSTVVVSGTVTIAGNTSAVISGNSSVVIISGNSSVTVSNTVTVQGNTTAVIQGNSTAVLSNAGMGAGSTNSMVTRPWANLAESTWFSTKTTSTTPSTLISSGASTAISVVDIVLTNSGSAETVYTLFSGTTAGTVLFRQALSSGGGGIAMTFAIPRRTAVAAALVGQMDPASTVYVDLGAYRST